MKRMRILAVLFLNIGLLSGQAPDSFEYVSPLPNSALHSRGTNIILRPGPFIEASSLSQGGILRVSGSESGEHPGSLSLSDDGRTVVFRPREGFEPGETVTVMLGRGWRTMGGEPVAAARFSFTVTPLQETLLPEDDPPYGGHSPGAGPAVPPEGSVAAFGDSLPGDFPELLLTRSGETAPGYLFGGSNSEAEGVGDYAMVLDNEGTVLYHSPDHGGLKQLSDGRFAYAKPLGGKHEYRWMVMDAAFAVVDSFQAGNGYIADNHDFQLLPNGHALILIYDVQNIDVSRIVEGGHPNAKVTGAVIQELDASRNVVFQWRSWDHVPLTDSYRDLTKKNIPYIHVNSVEYDVIDQNILLSCRETSEAVKISRQTGEILWRMAGKNNEFTFLGEHPENAPRYFKLQHDVRRRPDGNLTIFDNGADDRDPERTYSRAVEYALDEENRTVTLVWEYRHDPDILALTGGRVQRLPNGNSMISWGGAVYDGAPAATEVTPQGDVVFEVAFARTKIKGGFYRYAWGEFDPSVSVTHYELLEGNTYVFDEGESKKTGVTIEVESFTGDIYNELTVTRLPYGPSNPEYPGKAPQIQPVRVTVEPAFITAMRAEISFDAESFGLERPGETRVYHREFENGLFLPLESTYNPVTGRVRATMTRFGEFILGVPDQESLTRAPLPLSPEDGETVNYTLDVRFLWTPVGYVNTYRVQAATDEAFANLAADAAGLTATSYTLSALENDATYFWRVRSVNDAGESPWSETRRFDTVSPYITVVSPNGGESWQVGLEHRIRWEDNLSNDVTVTLLRNQEVAAVVATTPSTGTYDWDIDPYLTPDAGYTIRIQDETDETVFDVSDAPFALIDSTASVEGKSGGVTAYALYPNYPNPFNPVTRIRFALPVVGRVDLRVFDMLGQEVGILVRGRRESGEHEVLWDARDLPTGLYLCRMKSGEFVQTRKLMLQK